MSDESTDGPGGDEQTTASAGGPNGPQRPTTGSGTSRGPASDHADPKGGSARNASKRRTIRWRTSFGLHLLGGLVVAALLFAAVTSIQGRVEAGLSIGEALTPELYATLPVVLIAGWLVLRPRAEVSWPLMDPDRRSVRIRNYARYRTVSCADVVEVRAGLLYANVVLGDERRLRVIAVPAPRRVDDVRYGGFVRAVSPTDPDADVDRARGPGQRRLP